MRNRTIRVGDWEPESKIRNEIKKGTVWSFEEIRGS